MNLSDRERKLLVSLGIVVVLMAVWILFLKPSSEPIILPDDLFPAASPTAVVPGGTGTATGSPTFVIPVGARDPFKG